MSAFQTLVKNKLKKQGFTVLKIIKLSDSGYPDLLAIKEGKSIWVEVKESNDNLKELQKMRIDQLILDGFIAFCIQKNKGIIYPKKFYYNIDL
jgi:Holliday junction resolvase